MNESSNVSEHRAVTIRVPVVAERQKLCGNGICVYLPDPQVQAALVATLKSRETQCVALGEGFCVIGTDEELRLAKCSDRFIDKLLNSATESTVESLDFPQRSHSATAMSSTHGFPSRSGEAQQKLSDAPTYPEQNINQTSEYKKTRINNPRKPTELPVQYVVFGQKGAYFLRRRHGKCEWRAPIPFGQAVHAGLAAGKSVRKVALGPHSSFVLLWADGCVEFSNVQHSLAQALESGYAAQGIADVSIGSNDEWAVCYGDQGLVASGLSKECHEKMRRIQQGGGRVRQIVFGENGAFYFRFYDPNKPTSKKSNSRSSDKIKNSTETVASIL
eukprot:GHVP01042288.1.p1 GENE.GHVP01042288.1~~GHVP01042288.1.p1  ORF type:complete len:331 (+),score=44.36 GHVP01042288.1:111-1103(+)